MSTPPDMVRAIEAIILAHPGRERAIRGCEIAAAIRASGSPCHLRRVSEAVNELRARGVAILSTSADGYWLAVTDDERAQCASEIRKRMAALNRSLIHLDAACAHRVQLALGLEVRP